MTEEYSITIIPIGADGKVKCLGKDYTTAAKAHNVTINGKKFYIRENNSSGNDKLREAVGRGLEEMFKGIEINSPFTVKITKLEMEA